MRATYAAWACAALCAIGAPSFAQTGSPMGPGDYEAMRHPGPKRAVMLSACDGNIPLGALAALAHANAKATVFVSAKALAKDGELAAMLAKRPDLFEVGNLGAECMGRAAVLDGVAKAAKGSKPEGAKERESVEALARNVLAGSAAIKKKLGAAPRFFAFGLDFNNSASDPFDQARLLDAVSDYLAKPSAAARFDILASSKAGFDAWVLLVRMDRGAPGPVGGNKSYSESSIGDYLAKNGGSFSPRKASEAWRPGKRAYVAKELGAPAR